jgi:hypothetical protein
MHFSAAGPSKDMNIGIAVMFQAPSDVSFSIAAPGLGSPIPA